MMTIKLEKPQDYTDLYKKMGCIEYMMKFFHIYDDIEIGPICRALHMSKAYAISIGKGIGNDKFWCKSHKTSHSDLVIDESEKQMRSICPITGKKHEHPRYYNEVFGGSLITYENSDKGIVDMTDTVTNARTVYFLQFLWDPAVLNYKHPGFRRGFAELPREEKKKYIRGFIPLLEIDAADIDSEDAEKGRYDIFDSTVFDEFITADGYIKDVFGRFYGTGGFYKVFSGNGIYYIGYPNMVSSVDELERTWRWWTYKFCRGIKDYLGEDGAGLKYVHIDAPYPQWNSYYKIPFTLHKKYDRISIPLSQDDIINLEYIKKYSDIENITPKISEMLWREAGYE